MDDCKVKDSSKPAYPDLTPDLLERWLADVFASGKKVGTACVNLNYEDVLSSGKLPKLKNAIYVLIDNLNNLDRRPAGKQFIHEIGGEYGVAFDAEKLTIRAQELPSLSRAVANLLIAAEKFNREKSDENLCMLK